ncbi:hypothetical protein F5I97DRAFT_1877066 [Phlebopus sp. FC_14]|nr:hypothetical protein F5I97DRAFT_1877066 [Phlebopus sp. FC_14]
MAKPKHGQSNIHDDDTNLDISQRSSSPPRQRRQRRHHLRPSPQRRRRPARSSSSSLPCPSPAVLSALAVIAAAPPVVAGSPLPLQTSPPSFLCPFIERDNTSPISDKSPSITPHIGARNAIAPTPTLQQSKRGQVADKFVQGPDNRWRKTDEWTLYGSTCCSSTSVPSINDILSQPASSTQTAMPTVSAFPVALDASVLPAGWTPSSSSSSTDSAIIFSLSIVLAVAICGFMVGCISWRKKRKKPGKEEDLELKGRHRTRHDDTSEDEREREARGKLRIWAKATARWKANIRHSARRRRKRHLITSRASRPTSPVPPDTQEVCLNNGPIQQSRQSLDARRSGSPMSNTNDTPTIGERMPVSPISSRVQTYSPPDYQSLTDRMPSMSRVAYHPSSPTSSRGSLLLEHDDNLSPSDEPMPYAGPSDGHVAIGDKAELERIREMASAPPEADVAASGRTLEVVSAPELDEAPDELDDCVSQVVTSLPPSFPPFPSKADVPSGCFEGSHFLYDEDLSALGSDVGPSAPPFEASPSAPTANGHEWEPSAPSLDEDDGSQDWDEEVRFGENSMCSSSTSASSGSIADGHSGQTREGVLPSYRP